MADPRAPRSYRSNADETKRRSDANPKRPFQNLSPDWRERLEANPAHRRWVLWTCLAGCFATTFTMTILGVSLKVIADDLGSNVTTIAWVMTAPMLAQAVSAPLLGKLGDLHGHRRVYLIGFVAATIVATATAFAWNAGSLIGLRTLGQLAGTATMPASMAILFRNYDGRDRVKAMGWMSVVIAGAPVFGLAIGGVLIEAIGWRPIFMVQGGLSAVACIVAFFVLAETPRRAEISLDIRGAVVLAMAAFALTFAANRVPGWGLLDPRVLASLISAPLLLAYFVRIERRVEHPLLPLELLARRNFVLPLVIGFMLQFAYMGGFIISPLIMLGVFGLGQSTTAMWTIARPIALSASSPIGGQLGAVYGERAMIVAGSLSVFLAMAAFAAGANAQWMPLIVAGLILAGVGMGLAQPSLSTIVANAVEEKDHGIAVSTMATTTGIGAVTGISILTAMCADVGTAESFRNGYALGAIFAVFGILASLALRSVDHDLDRDRDREESRSSESSGADLSSQLGEDLENGGLAPLR
jgi:MFS family permease